MKSKFALLGVVLLLLLLAAQPALAHEGHEPVGTTLPDWVAWLMVFLAVALPVGLSVYLRNNGRL